MVDDLYYRLHFILNFKQNYFFKYYLKDTNIIHLDLLPILSNLSMYLRTRDTIPNFYQNFLKDYLNFHLNLLHRL
jgi:hypothetical protein